MRQPSRIKSFFHHNPQDSLLLSSGDSPNANFTYMSGLRLDNSVFLALRDSEVPILFVSKLNKTEAEKESGFALEVWKDSADFWRKLREALKGCRSLALDFSSLKAKTYNDMNSKLGKKSFRDASEQLLAQRGIKDEQELAKLKKSVHIARGIVNEAQIESGKTELELSKELKIAALEKGVELSFAPIVLSGANAAMPHGKSSEKRISDGEPVLIDFGVKYEGYCSDISRCFFTGKCEEERSAYEKLKGTFEALLLELKPGKKCPDIPRRCNELLKEHGFGELIHSPGHGIGLDVHESPSLSKRSKGKIREGMVLAIEPAFYGSYGLRYEDDVVIKNGKAVFL